MLCTLSLCLILWLQGPEFEAKVAKLVELGFQREAVIQALKLFDGNEEQAAGFLFGWIIWIQNIWSPFLCGLSVFDFFSIINLIHTFICLYSNFKTYIQTIFMLNQKLKHYNVIMDIFKVSCLVFSSLI